MKKFAFALSSLLLLSACQAGPQVLNTSRTLVRSPAAPLLRQSVAQASGNQGFYTLEDFRSFLAGKLHEALDQNKDQAVSAQEFGRLLNPTAVARFAEFDSNGDGQLQSTELQTAKNAIFSERYAEATLRQKLLAFFQTQDLDRDGFVSHSESKGNLNLLFDYNGDQKFDANEFVDAVASLLQLDAAKTTAFLKEHLG